MGSLREIKKKWEILANLRISFGCDQSIFYCKWQQRVHNARHQSNVQSCALIVKNTVSHVAAEFSVKKENNKKCRWAWPDMLAGHVDPERLKVMFHHALCWQRCRALCSCCTAKHIPRQHFRQKKKKKTYIENRDVGNCGCNPDYNNASWLQWAWLLHGL